MHNHFSPKNSYRATIGVDFQVALLKFNDDLEIRLQLWDIAGQERFSNMTRAYYKGAMGALVVFDQVICRLVHFPDFSDMTIKIFMHRRTQEL